MVRRRTRRSNEIFLSSILLLGLMALMIVLVTQANKESTSTSSEEQVFTSQLAEMNFIACGSVETRISTKTEFWPGDDIVVSETNVDGPHYFERHEAVAMTEVRYLDDVAIYELPDGTKVAAASYRCTSE